jgi:hypothetical protein
MEIEDSLIFYESRSHCWHDTLEKFSREFHDHGVFRTCFCCIFRFCDTVFIRKFFYKRGEFFYFFFCFYLISPVWLYTAFCGDFLFSSLERPSAILTDKRPGDTSYKDKCENGEKYKCYTHSW